MSKFRRAHKRYIARQLKLCARRALVRQFLARANAAVVAVSALARIDAIRSSPGERISKQIAVAEVALNAHADICEALSRGVAGVRGGSGKLCAELISVTEQARAGDAGDRGGFPSP